MSDLTVHGGSELGAVPLNAIGDPWQVQAEEQSHIKTGLMCEGHGVQMRLLKQQVAVNGRHQWRGVRYQPARCDPVGFLGLCQRNVHLLMGERGTPMAMTPIAQDFFDQMDSLSLVSECLGQRLAQTRFARAFSTQDGDAQRGHCAGCGKVLQPRFIWQFGQIFRWP